MKYKDGNYIQLSRVIFDDKYKSLSDGAKWLYCYLSELEHRYASDEKDWFFRDDQDIANALNWSVSKMQRYKKELRNSGLIRIGKMKQSQTSTIHHTSYRIIE